MKPEALCRLLTYENPRRALIFCNTKKQVDALTQLLRERNFRAEGLHGDLKQAQSDQVMKNYRSGETPILIATDIAARGLDISGIDIVFNYDLPEEEETYVHRIGRSARAGRSGKAFSFAVGKEIQYLQKLMDFSGALIQPRRLPSLQELEAHRRELLTEDLLRRVQAGTPARYKALAASLAEKAEPLDLLAALLARDLSVPASSEEDPLSKAPTRILRENQGGGPMVKLHLNAGKKQQLRVKDIVGAIAGETGLPGSALGAITLMDHFTYVEVPAEAAEDILTIMNGCEIKGRKVRFEVAK